MADFIKTNVEIKLHPKSSGPRFIVSSQTGPSSTWSLFQNEEILILPRLKPRRHPGVLPHLLCPPYACSHCLLNWAPLSLSFAFPPSSCLSAHDLTPHRDNSFPNCLSSPGICCTTFSACPSYIQCLRTAFLLYCLPLLKNLRTTKFENLLGLAMPIGIRFPLSVSICGLIPLSIKSSTTSYMLPIDMDTSSSPKYG